MTQTKPPATSSFIGKWKSYPAYKYSGVGWAGEIPEHWTVKRLKFVAKFFGGGTPSKENLDFWSGDIPWVSPKDMKAEIIYDAEDHITEYALQHSATRLIQPGAVLIVVRSGILRRSIPVAVNAQPVALNQDMKAIVTGSFVEAKYLAAAIKGCEHALLVEWRKEGATVESIEFELLANAPCPIPPITEQHAIADFLDRETAKINTLIAKKERLIKLLQEKRSALISHAVTRGLDPTVPMKDSGVEWLGKIPAHWQILPLKRIAKIRYGLGQPPAEMDEGIPFVRATNVKSGMIATEGMLYVDPTDIPPGRDAILSEGEIIVVRSGAYTGDSAIIPKEYERAVAGYDMVVTATRGHSSYIAWQLLTREVRDLQFSFYSLRAAQPHLNAEDLSGTLILVPSFTEQLAIATYLDYETAKIDALISRIHEAIEKLKEYSTALISAAVTGKIDVREEIAPQDIQA